MFSPKAPGRIGNPKMTLESEPRLNPKVLKALIALGMHKDSTLAVPVTTESLLEHRIAFERAKEAGLEALLNSFDFSLPVPGDANASVQLTRHEEFITGRDGNAIKVIIQRPADAAETPLPGVIYLHGGGMIILHTELEMTVSWAASLARLGMVAVLVDFRNALGPEGEDLRPFPRGLNDCVDATRWVHANKERLGISKLILQGDSGGANLSIATVLRASHEGWVHEIDGVFASAPYISNAYHMPDEWKLEHLPSLVECDGYIVDNKVNELSARLYDPTGENAKSPFAWPYWATEEQLKGLPPHFILADELDPLRDEGVDFARKLARAGVNVVGKVHLGAVHVGDIFLRYAVPELFLDLLGEIKTFIDRLN
ncbi:Carboxylesterase NlhH [Escovopsis weberi]|uniref:Carboxylesterase NlhH n=1 Tax=Escovopsis weberi TaxID=150374 RepID=A0A0M9VRL9_ESCWE|nr:Carboxylesterase NlhH [Escovopsis weberi]